MRVLLDTNVIVSAVTTRGLCADVFRAVLAAHELVTCAQVLQEVRRILRIKFDVPEQLIAEYLELIGQDAIVAEPEDLPDLPIQDQDDAEIVAAAIGARAEVLVTGDHELQGLKSVGQVKDNFPESLLGRTDGPGIITVDRVLLRKIIGRPVAAERHKKRCVSRTIKGISKLLYGKLAVRRAWTTPNAKGISDRFMDYRKERRAQPALYQCRRLNWPPFEVKELTLFQSVLSPQGSKYTPLQVIPLG